MAARGRARDARGGRREGRAGGAGRGAGRPRHRRPRPRRPRHPDLCRALHGDPRLDGAWMLAITAKGSRSDAALAAGADDYLHRPFTRGELLARAGAGLRAARQRSDDRLMRALMLNVPGAIYRSAWHAGHVVELISDEIERIAGYLPSNFVASTRRTLLSIVHPDDREMLERAVEHAAEHERVLRRRVPDRARRRRDALGARSRPARPRLRRAAVDRRGDVRHHRAPRRRGGAARARDRARPHRGAARLARAHRRGRRRRPPADRARPARRCPAAARPRVADVEARRGAGRGTPAEEVVAEASDAAARGAGRAARPRPRDPPGGARRARARRRARRPRRPLRRSRSRSASRPSARRPRSRRRSTSRSPRRSRTSPSTRRRRKASVTIEVEDGTLVAEVTDDGVGGASMAGGSGLRGLEDRLDAIGGTLTVHSRAGQGHDDPRLRAAGPGRVAVRAAACGRVRDAELQSSRGGE